MPDPKDTKKKIPPKEKDDSSDKPFNLREKIAQIVAAHRKRKEDQKTARLVAQNQKKTSKGRTTSTTDGGGGAAIAGLGTLQGNLGGQFTKSKSA